MRLRHALSIAVFLVAFVLVAAPRGRGLAVQEARADSADLGFSILKCFHPTADFVRAEIGSPHADEFGRTASDGRINFRGGLTGSSYFMTFVIHYRVVDGDPQLRVTPNTDTAPFPPNPSCRLRDWVRAG